MDEWKSDDDPQSTPPIHLERSEAELLGVDLRGQAPRLEKYPHDHPNALTEDTVGDAFLGDDSEESKEDVDEAISDALDRSGTDEDPG